jgi:photosystem II stability/assembly factor-like uncharacterized protein
VHGLGINPSDGAFFVATHPGLFRAAAVEKRSRRVADRYQGHDGLHVTGPDRFLGSGHPDGSDGLPPFLGLVRSTGAGSVCRVRLDGSVDRSTDGGRSWEQTGDAGGQPAAFEIVGDELYVALHDGTIKRSRDQGRTWRLRSRP